MFLGNDLLAQRLALTLGREGIRVTHATQLPVAVSQLRKKKFDLAIVDSSLESADEICARIMEQHSVPVALMVDESEADWKRVCLIKTDGFLTEGASDTELIARIKAILRRNQKLKQKEKV
jgi:two-component system response regulator VicR